MQWLDRLSVALKVFHAGQILVVQVQITLAFRPRGEPLWLVTLMPVHLACGGVAERIDPDV